MAEILARSDGETQVEQLLDVDVQTYLAGDLLPKVDIASMAHSLEMRSPLLDHALMETAAALPSTSKLKGRVTKRVLKDAVRQWVPDEILDRPKMGFSPPLGDWLRGDAARAAPRGAARSPRARPRAVRGARGQRGSSTSTRAGRANRRARCGRCCSSSSGFGPTSTRPTPMPLGDLVG